MFILPLRALALLAASVVWAQPPQSAAVPPAISVRAVEGDGAINSIRLRRARDPVVQVVDESGEPLEGASVSFLLPATGPSGVFGASGLSITSQTNERGMAAGRGLVPNQIAGQFRIRAVASWKGGTAAATLIQTNAEPVSVSSSKKIAVIALIAAGVAGGILAAAVGGGAAGTAVASPPPSTPGSITAGTPSFGPPR